MKDFVGSTAFAPDGADEALKLDGEDTMTEEQQLLEEDETQRWSAAGIDLDDLDPGHKFLRKGDMIEISYVLAPEEIQY